MTGREMQISFVTELTNNGNFISSSDKNSGNQFMPGSDIIFYWINRAVDKFIKTRYTGNNIKNESFEQTQKRINDLRTLVTESTISTSLSSIKPNSYQAIIPVDYFLTISEEVNITFIKDSVETTIRQGIKEITSDRYREEIDNPFGSHILHYYKAKPLRLYQGSLVLLISDGNYTIPTYYLRYIKNPAIVSLSVDCDLSAESHPEIVKIAVGMYLENTGNQRYSTYSNELNTME
jgi:hypothetical protein